MAPTPLPKEETLRTPLAHSFSKPLRPPTKVRFALAFILNSRAGPPALIYFFPPLSTISFSGIDDAFLGVVQRLLVKANRGALFAFHLLRLKPRAGATYHIRLCVSQVPPCDSLTQEKVPGGALTCRTWWTLPRARRTHLRGHAAGSTTNLETANKYFKRTH